MLQALRAMAGQIQDEKTRAAIEAALDGEKPRQPDIIKQQVVSGDEAAQILGLTRRSVQLLARAGTIAKAFLPGRRRAFGYVRESVEALAAGRQFAEKA